MVLRRLSRKFVRAQRLDRVPETAFVQHRRRDARKPWLVMSSFLKPIRHKAAFNVFSDMHRATDRTDGNRNRLCPVNFRSSLRAATARGASGTRCAFRIFIRVAGISHTAASRSNSTHSAARSSPGRTKIRASNSRATHISLGACPTIRFLGPRVEYIEHL